MGSTKRYKKGNKLTKKYKNGGRKNNISNYVIQTAGYNSLFTENQTGGQVSPRPAPAPGPAGLVIYQLEPNSLRNSLQSYGDAIQSIVETAQTGLDIYDLPTGAPRTSNNNTPSYNEILIQNEGANDLKVASDVLMSKFSGPNGLYKTIYGTSAVFTATPSPSPSPATQSGGQTPAPSTLSPVTGISLTILKNRLDEFGTALYNLNDVAEYYNSLFKTTVPLSEPRVSPGSTATFSAYSAFVSQQVSADSLMEAIKATYDAFTGTADYNRVSGTGSIGLYRSILGDNFVFVPPALPPGTIRRESQELIRTV